MHGQMHPNYWQITILLVVDLCSSLAYFMMTQPLPIACKLPIKTLVAKQLPTHTYIVYTHTYTHTYYDLVMSIFWLIPLVAPVLAQHVVSFKHDLLILLLKLGIIEVLSRKITTSPFAREKKGMITLLYYSCASGICHQCYIVKGLLTKNHGAGTIQS